MKPTPASVWADSAYRSEETEQWLGEAGFKSQIHYKGQRGKPPSAHKKRLNRLRSIIRARVEHVFGFQHNSMGGKLIRTIGLARAKTKIALMNLCLARCLRNSFHSFEPTSIPRSERTPTSSICSSFCSSLTYNIMRYLHLERRKRRNPLAQTI